jgi:hypothetical protein
VTPDEIRVQLRRIDEATDGMDDPELERRLNLPRCTRRRRQLAIPASSSRSAGRRSWRTPTLEMRQAEIPLRCDSLTATPISSSPMLSST